MAKKKEQDPTVALTKAPIPIGEIRVVDVMGCAHCGTVLHLHGREKLETRTVELEDDSWSGTKRFDVRGVFCPHCDAVLFDEETWMDHLVNRKLYDRDEDAAPEGKAPGAEQGAGRRMMQKREPQPA